MSPSLQPDPTALECAGAGVWPVANQGFEHLDQLWEEFISTGVGLGADKPRAETIPGASGTTKMY